MRKAANAAPKPPKAIVVVPRSVSDQVRALRKLFIREAECAGLRIAVFEAQEIREVSHEHWTRPVRLLAPRDAAEVYRLLHHGPVMVVAFTSAFIRRDPSGNPLTRKQALPLAQFVAHKAHFSLINGRPDIARALADFDAWRHTVACDGQDDPRILPLHTFLRAGTWASLGDERERQRFAREHGTGGLRTDSDGRRWERASVPHGRDVLTVAGATLPQGMHWDVQFRQHKGTLLCANEVWRVPQGCHVNVYPDGRARGKPGRGHARRVWPRGRS